MHQEMSSADAIKAQVTITLEGGFRHAEVLVEGQAIRRDASGSGSQQVEIVPPTVDVLIVLSAPIACTFKATIEINGKTQTMEGLMKHRGRMLFTQQFAFTAFGLPVPAGTHA